MARVRYGLRYLLRAHFVVLHTVLGFLRDFFESFYCSAIVFLHRSSISFILVFYTFFKLAGI